VWHARGIRGKTGRGKNRSSPSLKKSLKREAAMRVRSGGTSQVPALTHSLTLSLSLLHKRDETQKAHYTLWKFTPWMKNDPTLSWMKNNVDYSLWEFLPWMKNISLCSFLMDET
jgi:hypothetical protein